MTVKLTSLIDRSATIAPLPRYRVDGGWCGDSGGAEQKTDLAA